MQNTLAYAQAQDAQDSLRSFRAEFYIPQHTDGTDILYFTGNSLGLQPKRAMQYLQEEMQKWQTHGVEGHFTEPRPWFDYHKHLRKGLAHLTGGKENEVVAMNSLTTNLHILLTTFYQPVGKRTKILIEEGAFPSDQYVAESQARFYGLNPKETVVELPTGADAVAKIKELGDTLAVVMLGGVNYYTGQFFDLPTITRTAQEVGAKVGFDLAHTIGNLPLQLHDWGVDFAAWCSYKYLNAGPGGVGGIFVHEKHLNPPQPRLFGWWGYEEKTRFLMQSGFKPEMSADAWQMSNAPILSMSVLLASLAIFEEADIYKLREKSLQLTQYLAFVIEEVTKESDFAIRILTPSLPTERGCQLSLEVAKGGKALHEQLTAQGIIADWREPAVIRLAPVPLYNSFEDVYLFGERLKKAITLIKL
jgi:kynureninase